ncbi:HD domain-containing protein [Fodinicola feengrottensis]|uniref:HD domain-containing protein n=1 Tax=Fodinicola feengrottensis TaxID=435914 RepID=UPI002443352D|nr:HD domain-containing protein [Fodinicola feengrottensis]
MKPDDPRVRRSHEHGGGAGSSWAASDPYRADRDRVVESPFFARLAGVTQVVSPTGSGLLLHNRLTHSLKVAQVAVRLAERVSDVDAEGVVARLGGCDPTVVEAAALAHDLGHPPFGHLGEQVLDRLARQRLGLPDGFEGNAQSFRIITTTDVRARSGVGMDLTAAVRAAVLKYPWARRAFPRPHPSAMPVPRARRGAVSGRPGRRVAQVFGLSERTRRSRRLSSSVRRSCRALAANCRGGRDGHCRRHRVRHS